VPVGFAFRDWYSRFGEALVQYGFALDDFGRGAENQEQLLYYRLTSRDIGATVILGDPMVAMRIANI
jgi:hypothetical protein